MRVTSDLKLLYAPGEEAGAGHFREVGPQGGQVPTGRRLVHLEGEFCRLPPTTQAGRRWLKTPLATQRRKGRRR